MARSSSTTLRKENIEGGAEARGVFEGPYGHLDKYAYIALLGEAALWWNNWVSKKRRDAFKIRVGAGFLNPIRHLSANAAPRLNETSVGSTTVSEYPTASLAASRNESSAVGTNG